MCIKKQTALKVILGISVAGLLFSGYLSYGELFKKVCLIEGGCSNLLGLPVCVYGFLMYAVIFIIAILGLKSRK